MHFTTIQKLSKYAKLFQADLVEQVALVTVALVEDEPQVGAGKLKVQRFLLLFLKIRLLVGTWSHKAQLTIPFVATQLHKHLYQLRYFVLVQQQSHLFGADGHVKLYGQRLGVRRVMCRLPASWRVRCEAACRMSWVLAGD